jgi:hypothetical protein
LGDGIDQQVSVSTADECSERAAVRAFGGWALIVGGVLLFGALVVIALLPAPPAAPSELARWVHEYAFRLSVCDELLFFAVVCLTPGVVVVFRTTRFRRPVSSLLGYCSLLLAMTLVAVVVVVGTGRRPDEDALPNGGEWMTCRAHQLHVRGRPRRGTGTRRRYRHEFSPHRFVHLPLILR